MDNGEKVVKTFIWLLRRSPLYDIMYTGYVVNWFQFKTWDHYDNWGIQNNGVYVVAITIILTVKDKHLIVRDMTFYKVIIKIWELNYHKFIVLVLKYKWIDCKNDVKVDKLGFILVDLNQIV